MPAAGNPTLAQLIQQLAESVNDLHLGTPTTSATNGGDSLIDTANLYQPDGHWRGGFVYVYSGTGNGQERIITDSVSDDSKIFIRPVWTTGPLTTSAYQLTKLKSRTEYKRLINQAIQELQELYLVPKIDETIVMATDDREYAIPTDFIYISALWSEDSITAGRFDTYIDDHFWGIKKGAAPQLEFSEWWSPTATKKIRIVGQKRPVQLSLDTDIVEISGSVVLNLAKYHLHLSMAGGNSDQARFHMQEANTTMALLENARTLTSEGRPWPNSRPVWW